MYLWKEPSRVSPLREEAYKQILLYAFPKIKRAPPTPGKYAVSHGEINKLRKPWGRAGEMAQQERRLLPSLII